MDNNLSFEDNVRYSSIAINSNCCGDCENCILFLNLRECCYEVRRE